MKVWGDTRGCESKGETVLKKVQRSRILVVWSLNVKRSKIK